MKSLNLVGGWTNPFEKYARQNGIFSPKSSERKSLKPPPSFFLKRHNHPKTTSWLEKASRNISGKKQQIETSKSWVGFWTSTLLHPFLLWKKPRVKPKGGEALATNSPRSLGVNWRPQHFCWSLKQYILPRKRTNVPWKSMVGSDVFPIQIVPF